MRGPETDVYLDEYAHVANDKELWIVVRDFQIIGGHITMNSTPYGKRGKYFEVVEPLMSVYKGLSPKFKTAWSYHHIHFTECPRLAKQEKFLREGMTDIDFAQEYECLTPNNLVVCNPEIKEIYKINENDKVLTNSGKFEKVKGIREHNYNGNILKLKTFYNLSFPLEVTPEHPILAIKRPNNIHHLFKQLNKISEPTFIPSLQLEKGDFLIYTYPNEVSSLKKIEKYTINEDFLRIIGYYLSEGCLSNNAVCFSFGFDEKNRQIIDKCINSLKSLGFNPKIYKKKTVNSVVVNNKEFNLFIKRICPGRASEKKIPNMLMNIDPKKQMIMLRAIWEGDGCDRKEQHRIGLVSKVLIFQ
jgi:hypothetical protein